MLSSTILICTKDREEDLRRCLDSICEQQRTPDEAIIVDSGAQRVQGLVQEFAAALPRCAVKYVRSEPGLTRQRNIGVGVATKDIVHFLDDDVILDPACVDEIQKTFEAPGAEDVVAVSPMLRLAEGRPPRPCSLLRKGFLMTRVDGDGRMLPSGFGTFTWYAGYKDLHPLQVACGCCAYRRSIFDRIRFDEFFAGYGYMEDLDFSYRAGNLGRMVGNPRATMLHVASAAARPDWRRLVAMQIINHHYVFTRLLPPDWRHRICFWWSEFGETLRRLVRLVGSRDLNILLGAVDGYRTILRPSARREK